MTANPNRDTHALSQDAAAPAPQASVAAATPAAVVFTIAQVESVKVFCPDVAPMTAQIANGTRAEFTPGAFAMEITYAGQAGTRFTTRFEDVKVIRQLTGALGLGADTIARFLQRKKLNLSAAMPKGPARSGMPRANGPRVGRGGATGPAAGNSPSPTQPAPASDGAAPAQPAMPPVAAPLDPTLPATDAGITPGAIAPGLGGAS